jgi:hypothetical protein
VGYFIFFSSFSFLSLYGVVFFIFILDLELHDFSPALKVERDGGATVILGVGLAGTMSV